ncbi:MAG: hypothetical protein ABIK86_01710 [candidate division WOR-3 bacterium]
MSYVHRELAAGSWFKYSLVEQLANVGSEVERAIRWRREGRHDAGNKAMERALELLGLTIADPKNRRRLKEVCRVQELLVDWYYGENQYGSTDESWQRYFLGFAWAAQARKYPAR